MFRFENSIFLYTLVLVPAFALLYFLLRNYRKNLLKKYGDISLLNQLMPEVSKYKNVLKISLLLSGLAFLILGIANPQIGTKLENFKREGIDVIIAIDVSNSMKAEDVKPNRLERAKQYVSKLIDKMYNDRIGLIVFAGDAFIQLPLTTDYSAAKLFLSTVDNDLVYNQGTAIGKAIELAMKSFKQEEKKYKALIIITDGENHEDDAISMAGEAAKTGIVIYTIGMGSVQMKIPLRISAGLSMVLDKKYLLSLDASSQAWSNYAFNDVKSSDLRNELRLSAGFEYRPKQELGLTTWQQIIWRAGLSYEQTQYQINNIGINQFAVSGGFSFPLSYSNTIDVAIQYGISGTTDSNLIKEKIIKVNVGISIGELWFLRREE